MKKPAVSVLMRTFNCFSGAAPYDPSRAIESVLFVASAHSEGVELIVLDDGSTDQTVEVVKKFGKDIRLIEPGKMGPIALLNKGIQEARAPLVACFDSDDLMSETYFTRLAEPFRWGNCAYAFCDNSEVRYGESDKLSQLCHLHGNPYMGTGVGGVMFKRWVLVQMNGYDASLCTDEYYAFPECDLLMKIEEMGWGSSYVPAPLWTYVRRPGSMSDQQRSRMKRGKQVLKKRHGWLPDIRSY